MGASANKKADTVWSVICGAGRRCIVRPQMLCRTLDQQRRFVAALFGKRRANAPGGGRFIAQSSQVALQSRSLMERRKQKQDVQTKQGECPANLCHNLFVTRHQDLVPESSSADPCVVC